MSEAAEAVVEAFVRAINRQDVEALAGLMTEEHRFIDALGNVFDGRETMRDAWKAYFRMVPDYTITVDEFFADEPIVVLLGTAQGCYAAGGKVTAERRWSTPVAIRAFVQEGRIAEWRVYADNEPLRKLMAQAG